MNVQRKWISVWAMRVGGSGHVGENLHRDMETGLLPREIGGIPLHQGSLNLILEAGFVFPTPTGGDAEIEYEAHGTQLYLTRVRFALRQNGGTPMQWTPGYILRNREHPREFDHIVEILAPSVEGLTSNMKEWFKVDGSFYRAGFTK